MFNSLKTKILLVFSIILVINAAAIIYFTYRYVGRTMLQAEETSARNVLRVVQLNIKGMYNQLLFDKLKSIRQHKMRLKELNTIVASGFEKFAMIVDTELMPLAQAQKEALNWLRAIDLKDDNLFVLDQNGIILAHSNAKMRKRSLAAIRDIKNRLLTVVMRYDNLPAAGDYAIFHWQNPEDMSGNEGKRLAYFAPINRWQWTIGAVIDITDMEAEAQKDLEKGIAELKIVFDQIKIAQTGTTLLFDGKGVMLIKPRGDQSVDYAKLINAHTGNPLLEDFMQAINSNSTSARYIDSQRPDKPLMEAFIAYFKPLDWYIVVAAPLQEIGFPARHLVRQQGYIIAAIFIISLVAVLTLVIRISRPLGTLTRYAKGIPSHDFTAADSEVNPIDDLPRKYKDEVGRLAKALLFMKAELTANIRDLVAATAARERIESELDVAREIQMGILPKNFPALPDNARPDKRDALDLFASLSPAREVGGDLYDFFFIDNRHLCFTLGDVSDKGVPAALFMVITRTLIKTMAEKNGSPAKMMSQINSILSSDNPNCMFVTLIIGIIDIQTGRVRYANGGHNPCILVKSEAMPVFQQELSGPVVGTMDGIAYKELTLTLEPRDFLFLYTDGVTEAMNPDKVLFSDDRLLQEINALRDQSVKNVIAGISAKIKEHAGSAPQSDDIAMLMIKYNGARANLKTPHLGQSLR
jgi:sigma-B regulation protein RsbU (phosphoserine phosphatase)